MRSFTEFRTIFKDNKGKFIVLIIYILVVFISPLEFFTPIAQNQSRNITESLVTKEADASFRRDFALLKKGESSELYLQFAPEAVGPMSTSSLQALSSYFASSTDQMQIVGGRFNKTISLGSSTTNYDITYQIQNNDSTYKYLLAEVQAQDSGNGLQLLGLSANKEIKSVQEQGRFDFAKQGIYLLFALCIPLFITYTALRYLLRAKTPKWSIFLVILFLTVYLNLSPEKIGFNVGLGSFAVKAGEWGPWIFSIPAPLGAIYYYVIRKEHEITKIAETSTQ